MKPLLTEIIKNYNSDKNAAVKKLTQAIDSFDRANPATPAAYGLLIAHYGAHDEMQRILFHFEKYQKLKIKTDSANDIDIYGAAGLSYQKTGAYKKAVKALEQYRKLVKLYAEGKLDTPECAVRKPIYANAAERLVILKGLVDAYTALNDYKKAEEIYIERKLLTNPDWDGTLLTIGMIVKNEEKILDLCLSALSHLRETVKSELIIVDTGSEDKTVEIASKYADEVRHFEWINDFSAARNESLRGAHGDWFMFLDADEIFKGTHDIEAFFESGEYVKYNFGNYRIRSYGTGDVYTEFSAARMTRIFENTKFYKSIHESLGLRLPVKYLTDVADHRGYEGAKSQTKALRNLDNLMIEYEKNPNDLITIYEIASAYIFIDQEKAFKFLFEGIKKAEEQNSPLILAVLHSVVGQTFFDDERYQECIDFLEPIIRKYEEENTIAVAYISTYAVYAESCHKLNINSKAIEAYERFYTYAKSYLDNELLTNDMMIHSVYYVLPIPFQTIMLNFCDTLINEKDFAKAEGVSGKLLPPEKTFGNLNQAAILQKLLIMRNIGSYSGLEDFMKAYGDPAAGENTKDFLFAAVKNEVLAAPDTLIYLKTVIAALDHLGEDFCTPDFKLLFAVLFDHFAGVKITDEKLRSVLEKAGKLTPISSDLIPLMMVEERSLNILADLFNPNEYEKFFSHICVYREKIAINLARYKNTENYENLSPRAMMMLAGIAECILANPKYIIDVTAEMIADIFKELSARFIKAVYKFDPETHAEQIIPPVRTGFYLAMSQKELKKRQFKKQIYYLRLLSKDNPDLRDLIRGETQKAKVYFL